MLKRVRNEMVSLLKDVMVKEERKKLIVRNQDLEYRMLTTDY